MNKYILLSVHIDLQPFPIYEKTNNNVFVILWNMFIIILFII